MTQSLIEHGPPDDIIRGVDPEGLLIHALVDALRRHTGVFRLQAYQDPENPAVWYVGEKCWVSIRLRWDQNRQLISHPSMWILSSAPLTDDLARRVVEHYAEVVYRAQQSHEAGR